MVSERWALNDDDVIVDGDQCAILDGVANRFWLSRPIHRVRVLDEGEVAVKVRLIESIIRTLEVHDCPTSAGRLRALLPAEPVEAPTQHELTTALRRVLRESLHRHVDYCECRECLLLARAEAARKGETDGE